MKNIFNNTTLDKLSSLCDAAQRIVIISHTNPDGDAIGSGLALTLFLRDKYSGKNIRFFVPNNFPEFLSWVDKEQDVEVFSSMCEEGAAFLAAADLVFVVDFNQTSRLEKMSTALDANLHATRVLIDHHIAPAAYDLSFHTTESSSTAYLIYSLIENWSGTKAITRPIADALYLGMMTDTGNFSFGNLTPELYRAVAVLVENGINPSEINRAVFNTQSEDRLRMVGYLISDKLRIVSDKSAAYITLTRAEKERFSHQIGDTEGVVNIPLTIKGIRFSAILIETKECIKVSLRSVGDLDVNIISNKNFNGGGHKNAAGGKYFGTMDEAVAQLEKVITEL